MLDGMNGMVEGGRPGKSIKGAGCPCFLASSITIGIGIQQPLQFLESSQANPLRQRHTHPHKLTYLRKKMQFKLAAILALATAVAALPAAENSQPADGNDGVSILATRKWQASGGCKTDWAGRCNAQCIGEASQKGYKCKDIDSDITGSNCFIGWSTCECTCFY